MSQRQWTITVPLKKNDGSDAGLQKWELLEQLLFVAASGFSKTLIHGSWVNDHGVRFDDSSYRYEMLIDNGHGTVDRQMTEIADFVKASWQQETVLITETETRFQFV